MRHLMPVTTGVADHRIVGLERKGECPLGESTGRRRKHIHVREDDSQSEECRYGDANSSQP